MKITFLGAAHQVTGSHTLVEWSDNRYFLVDYGMEQGENDLEMAELPVSPSIIEYVFLTHAHIDHSGLLPLLYKQGFRGRIYATAETTALCSIMLADSAQIQETDAASETKKNLRTGGPEVIPLYTVEDAAKTMEFFNPCEYNKIYMIDEGLSIRFIDAGHLLGSSFIEFFLEDQGKTVQLVCSGDVGNINQPIIKDPQAVTEADYLLIESTYGNRLHDTVKEPIPILIDVLKKTFERKGSVIIPSFAVGRQCDPICLDEETLAIMSKGKNPIWFDGLNITVSAEESKALNADSAPKVIIASGGMCEGGRIRHHLKHHLWDKRNTILFVGFQAVGTLGRIIHDGATSVKIFGEQIDVNAEIAVLDGVSGHADRDGLLRWLSQFEKKPSYIFVNHGDDESCTAFSKSITDQFSIPSLAPYSGSEFDLLAGEWIRLTDPVLKKKKASSGDSAVSAKKQTNTDYLELKNALLDLTSYVGRISGHANNEFRELTRKIRSLISDQD